MQGQILHAAPTGNQGLILGDDAVRYTFTPGNWRDYSVRAAAGMRVEFIPDGTAAANVSVIQAPVYSQPSPQPAVAPIQRMQPEVHARASGSDKNRTVAGLLVIFLGPVGFIVMRFYLEARSRYIELIVTLIGLGFFMVLVVIGIIVGASNSQSLEDMQLAFPVIYGAPFLVVCMPISIIRGITLLMMSDESFNEYLHFTRDHHLSHKGLEHCLSNNPRLECPAWDERNPHAARMGS